MDLVAAPVTEGRHQEKEQLMSLEKVLDRIRARVRSRFLFFQKWSWEMEVEGREKLERLVRNGDRFILCFWHGKYVPILPAMQGIDGQVITSAGRSGEMIERIARDFGFGCTQIPHRGGERSMRLMEDALSRASAAAIAVDGPLGPYHHVKLGAVRLAARIGCHLVPVSVDAHSKYILKNRWDLLEIPYPFTRVCLVIGEPITVPAALGRAGITARSENLGQTLERLDEKAARLIRDRQ